jgi:hypothetical protein
VSFVSYSNGSLNDELRAKQHAASAQRNRETRSARLRRHEAVSHFMTRASRFAASATRLAQLLTDRYTFISVTPWRMRWIVLAGSGSGTPAEAAAMRRRKLRHGARDDGLAATQARSAGAVARIRTA